MTTRQQPPLNNFAEGGKSRVGQHRKNGQQPLEHVQYFCVLSGIGAKCGWLFWDKSHQCHPVCPLLAAALQALKRKKRYEKQLAQIDGTLSTIEFQREALENANTNTEVLKNMGFAAKAMKAAHDNM